MAVPYKEVINTIPENPALGGNAIKWLLNTHLASWAKLYLPNSIRDPLRALVTGEKPRYPLDEPIVKSFNGLEIKFWIKNRADWYRILSDRESGYRAELLDTLSKKGPGTFVDIGSAQGIYSLPAAAMGWRTYAIDPDPLSQQALQANIVINPGLESKIIPLPLALGDKSERLTLYKSRRGRGTASLRKTSHRLVDKIDVQVEPLSKLISEDIVQAPQIVKFDPEGAEHRILLGMEALLRSDMRPGDLFVEIHDAFLPKFGSSRIELLQFLDSCGYYAQKMWDQDTHCHFVCRG